MDAVEEARPTDVLARPSIHGWRRSLRSPWTTAIVVLLFYTLWLAAFLLTGHEARDAIYLGKPYVLQSHRSAVIQYDPTYHYVANNRQGYDGQYAYFIALDPANARYYVDDAAYRYTRILYPLAARLLALGQPALVPYTLVAVNLLAAAGGTLALAAWLKRKGVSAWLALLFGLSPGVCWAIQRDLTEPLGYALVALGVSLFDFGGRRRVLWASVAFGLAALARESTLVFPLVYALALVFTGSGAASAHSPGRLKPRLAGGLRMLLASARERTAQNWRPMAVLLSLAVVPFALYKLFLLLWLGSLGTPASLTPVVVPFAGVLAQWPWGDEQGIIVGTVILPALVCAGLAIWAIRRRLADAATWALLANVLLFVVLLNPRSYVLDGTVRITLGVTLAALLCVPVLDLLTRRNRGWLALCGALWLATLPFWLAMPLMLQY
jgi:hypothetical protein